MVSTTPQSKLEGVESTFQKEHLKQVLKVPELVLSKKVEKVKQESGTVNKSEAQKQIMQQDLKVPERYSGKKLKQ
jgi:hypothetical protein